ncbi:MAG: DUF3135 domain-containing protein [Sterolibacterium sp.]|nr:DUF3135 domain-containing protein [Sterolibacterium sp.]
MKYNDYPVIGLDYQEATTPAVTMVGDGVNCGAAVGVAGAVTQRTALSDVSSLKPAGNPDECQSLELPGHEVLARLAHDDPQAFEALRREMIESFIDRAPMKYRHRLRGIQFRVDSERRLSLSALGSTVRIYQMMWGSFLCLNSKWQDLVCAMEQGENSHDSTSAMDSVQKESARILAFRPLHAREQC